MLVCIGSKIIEVDNMKISSLPAKSGSDIYIYLWHESFSKKGYVSKRYKNLSEFYSELRSGMIIVFEIKVGE